MKRLKRLVFLGFAVLVPQNVSAQADKLLCRHLATTTTTVSAQMDLMVRQIFAGRLQDWESMPASDLKVRVALYERAQLDLADALRKMSAAAEALSREARNCGR